MVKRGPRPTPTALLRLVGSDEPDRYRQNEPKPEASEPVKPDWITGEAEKVWTQVTEQLSAMGVLTTADGAAIGRYCVLLVRWVRNTAFIDEHGETYPINNPDGSVKCKMPFPQVPILNQLANQILRLEQEFGLTPSSRTSLKVNPSAATPKVASRTRA